MIDTVQRCFIDTTNNIEPWTRKDSAAGMFWARKSTMWSLDCWAGHHGVDIGLVSHKPQKAEKYILIAWLRATLFINATHAHLIYLNKTYTPRGRTNGAPYSNSRDEALCERAKGDEVHDGLTRGIPPTIAPRPWSKFEPPQKLLETQKLGSQVCSKKTSQID